MVDSLAMLICDDHKVFTDGLASVMIDYSFIKTIYTAHCEKDIYKKMHKYAIDFIIMDIELPGRSGIEIAKTILMDSPNTKVLMLSMHDSPEIINKILKSNIHGYLSKNIDTKELVQAICKIQAGERYFKKLALKKVKDFSIKTSSKVDLLTVREKEVLIHLAQGKAANEISSELYISEHTVRSHLKNLKKKLGAQHNTKLVAFAYKNLLIQ